MFISELVQYIQSLFIIIQRPITLVKYTYCIVSNLNILKLYKKKFVDR